MTKKITTATDAQWAQIEQLRIDTMAAQTAQIPAARVRDTVGRMYALMGEDAPLVVMAQSPFQAAVFAAILTKSPDDSLYDSLGASLYASRASLRDSLHASLGDSLDASLRASRASLRASLGASFYASLRDSLHASLDASLDGSLHASLRASLNDVRWLSSVWWRPWAAWYRGGEILGVTYDVEKLRLFTDWCECCPVVVAYKGLAIVSANPVAIHWDPDEPTQLHHASGPAVRYADGWGFRVIHGVRVPAYVVEHPETITLDAIKAEENAEVRRIMRERYGDGRYLTDIGATVIDADTVPTDALAPGAGAIHRALIEDDEGLRFLVGSDGSTERVYYMPTDRNNPPATCVAAYEQLNNGLRQADCILEA